MATTTRKSKAKASSEKAPEAPVLENGKSSPEQTAKACRATKAERTSAVEQPAKQPEAPLEAAVAANHEHSNGNSPAHVDIELRAYEIFIARGATHGQDLEDWLKAEREIRDRAES